MVPLIRIAQRRRRSRISICVIAIWCQLGAGVLLTELEDGLKDRVGSILSFLGGSGGGTSSTDIASSFCGFGSDSGNPNIRNAAMSRCRTREAGKASLRIQRSSFTSSLILIRMECDIVGI
jgi:hypothetical protein